MIKEALWVDGMGWNGLVIIGQRPSRGTLGAINIRNFNFYRTRVRSLGMLVSNSLTQSLTDSMPFSKLD